uniref:Uncharacterized protein n=1 Tax=Coccolithus braarudii TaxID=221442 RepID=A0A7S0Q3Q6_9EUKA|mmetsp:Transcript_3164/g.6623  ORF Transcript_3164/g.6623 Transcript_3164/m.6623 type:complete len:134 (+) Transcript_3164:44-445(+)
MTYTFHRLQSQATRYKDHLTVLAHELTTLKTPRPDIRCPARACAVPAPRAQIETRRKPLNAVLCLSKGQPPVTIRVRCALDLRPRNGRALAELLHDETREAPGRAQPVTLRDVLVDRLLGDRLLVHNDQWQGG